MVPAPTLFNLPWHQHDHYWITLYARGGEFSATARDVLQQVGLTSVSAQIMALQTEADWKTAWEQLYSRLHTAHLLDELEVVLMPGDAPSPALKLDRKPPAAIQAVAESWWLGNVLMDEGVQCYLQPIMSSNGQVVGYESFARVNAGDGEVIAGDKIIEASKALNIEYKIDRHLHVQALRTFISSGFDGYLFINFLPGFIHRPAIYMEGLRETVKSQGIAPSQIVLEVTKAETAHDIEHLKHVCDYARSCGYLIAIDGVGSDDTARKLMPEIRPDFIKIDMTLARRVHEPAKRSVIQRLVKLTHTHGGRVIGGGVETEEIRDGLAALGVDLFQGYLFSPPMAVNAA